MRLTGLAAILAGSLRGIASFVPSTARGVLLLYFVTDIFILFGTTGLYEFLRPEIGRIGLLGFLLEMVGVAILIGREVAIFGPSAYPVGALIFAAGLDLFGIASWKAKRLPPWIILLWILSTVVGPVGFLRPGLNFLFVASGVMFAIGFAAAGVRVFASQTAQQPLGTTRAPRV